MAVEERTNKQENHHAFKAHQWLRQADRTAGSRYLLVSAYLLHGQQIVWNLYLVLIQKAR